MQFGPGLLPTFLYYFTSTAILFTLIATKGMGLSLESGIPQQLGSVSGLVAGVLGAYFNRTIAFTTSVQSQKKFLIQLENYLTQMGYALSSHTDDLRVYQRSGLSQWMSGKVFVQLETGQATIASRASTLRKLKAEICSPGERDPRSPA